MERRKISQFRLVAQVLAVIFVGANLFFLWRVWGSLRDGTGEPKRDKLEILTLVDSNCKECTSLSEVVKFIKESNVDIKKEESFDYANDKAKVEKLVQRYRVTRLPALILKGARPTDEQLGQFWDNFGEIVEGDFVLRKLQPPYRDLLSGEVRGLFRVTFLTDDSCEKCYDVRFHKNAFLRLSMSVINERDIDVSSDEGKELIKKYDIKLVPTILVDGELDEYEGFQTVWPVVGTKEEDGVYVFRGVKDMGTYRDLATGKVVEGGPAGAASSGGQAGTGGTAGQ